MARFKEVVRGLSPREYTAYLTYLHEQKANKSALLLNLEWNKVPQVQQLQKLDVGMNAFYVLRSRLLDIIEDCYPPPLPKDPKNTLTIHEIDKTSVVASCEDIKTIEETDLVRIVLESGDTVGGYVKEVEKCLANEELSLIHLVLFSEDSAVFLKTGSYESVFFKAAQPLNQ